MIETFRGVAHPWFCDVMGHLNSRHFAAMFDDASFHYLQAAGFDWATIREAGRGWADVRAETSFRAEVPLGGLVVVRSGTVKIGRSSLAYRHEMTDFGGGRLHATMDMVSVWFDLEARKAVPIPEALRAGAAKLQIAATS